MPNNLVLAQEPDSACPYPVKHCGLKLCFEASDYTNIAAANAFVTFELDPDNVPWVVGSTLVVFGTTFTVVSGAPVGPNQVTSSSNPSIQWNNFLSALMSGLTVGSLPFTDYYSISSGYYITITSVAPGLNAPAPSGLFAGGLFVDSSADGVTGSTKSGYHVILDLYRMVAGNWEKVCGQYDNTYVLPLQELVGGGNNVCFDITGAFSVLPTPPPSDGSTWYLQTEALARYYARYAAFYRDEEDPCGNSYSGYEQTVEFKVINAVFALTNQEGIAPYCYAASEEERLLLTQMPSTYEVCCDAPVWLSLYFDPEDFEDPVELEYLVELLFAGGATYTELFPIGEDEIADPSFFTFLANPYLCELPEGITERASIQFEIDEPNWTLGSTLTFFGITLTVVAGTPGVNELNPDANPSDQMLNFYNALLAAEISPGVLFTTQYNIVYAFTMSVTAIGTGFNPPNPVGDFDGGIAVLNPSNGGGGQLTQISVTVQIPAEGENEAIQIAQTQTISVKNDEDCCCATLLYFVSELGNIDFIEGTCPGTVTLDLDVTTTGKPESCSDWINSGMWEVNNVAQELQTCYIAVKREHEKYIRSFLKSVNKFWLDTDTGIYNRIIPAQNKYTLRRGAEKVYIEFSFYISYNLPNQIN